MTRSDSKIDLDKYKPSLAEARLIADEKAAQARLKKALDNPALDVALAEVRAEAAALHEPAGKPSPWAAGAAPSAESVDKAALPSANAPAAPPVTKPVKTKQRAETRRPFIWSPATKGLAAIALAFLPAMVVVVLFVRPPPPAPRDHTPPGASAQASGAGPAPTTRPTAVPDAVAPAATSATAAPSTAPAPVHGAPTGTHPRPKPPGAIDDPYDAAPATAPPKSVEPPTPPVPPSAAPTTTAAPKASSGFDKPNYD